MEERLLITPRMGVLGVIITPPGVGVEERHAREVIDCPFILHVCSCVQIVKINCGVCAFL